ncbi:MAG: extracellular solute-binding protein [Opitutaceae bacterium]|nr:extracellular solute-binding protein [Opitutaceae bacterium]
MPLRWTMLFLFFATCRLVAGEGGKVLELQMQPASYGTRFFEEAAEEWGERSGWRMDIGGDPRVHDKVRVRVMAGDEPDATDATLDYEALIGAGRIVDLTSYLDGPNWDGTGAWRDDFLPGILDRWTRGGRVYGVPYAFAVWALFYNQQLFERNGWRAPQTWDDYFELARTCRTAGVAPLAFPGMYPRYGDAVLRSAIHQLAGPEGYRAFRGVEPSFFSTPEFAASAAVLQKVARESFMPGWEGMSHTSAQQAFFDGRAAMVISASWMLPEMRGKIPAGFRLGAVNLPRFPEGKGDAGAVQAQAAYFFIMVKGDPERERAMVDYLRFLTSAGRARAFARELGAQVSLRTVQPGDYADPAARSVGELMHAATAVYDSAAPLTPVFQSFLTQGFNDARHELLQGRITPGEFARRVGATAEAESRRIGNPNTVEVRHGLAAGLLGLSLLGMVVVAFRKRGGARGMVEKGALPLSRGATLVFVGLPLAFFAAFVLVPGMVALVSSLMGWNGVGEMRWVGLANYKVLLLESDVFWTALRNNLFLMCVPTLLVVPTALFFAALLHRGVFGAGFFRAVFLFPNLLGGTAAALLWMNAFDPHSGLVNAALVKLGAFLGSEWLLSFSGYAWLGADRLYWTLVPIYLWMACGFNLVLYLAAMQRIDPELYEAAQIDGASPVRQFFVITLPLIWDIIAVSAVFIVVAGLNTFEMVWLLTSQEPTGGTHVLSTLMVSTLFKEYQVGRATAIAVVLAALVIVGSLAVRRVLGADKEEAS